jgi:hypothetical protein
MVKDRYTGHVILAWPDLDIKKEDEDNSKKGQCSYCMVEDATRVCDQCYGDDGSYVSYCFGCFAMVHQKDLQKRDHTYTLKEAAVTGKVSKQPPMQFLDGFRSMTCVFSVCSNCYALSATSRPPADVTNATTCIAILALTSSTARATSNITSRHDSQQIRSRVWNVKSDQP